MCTVALPPDVSPLAVNRYIIYQMFRKTQADTKCHIKMPQRIQLLVQSVLPEGLKSFTLVPDFFRSFFPYLFLCRHLFVASFLHE